MKLSRIAPLFAGALVVGLTACQSSTVEPPDVNGQWEQQDASFENCDGTVGTLDVSLTILQEGSDLTGTLDLTDVDPLAFEGQMSTGGTITGVAIYSDPDASDIVAVDLALADGTLDGAVRIGSACAEPTDIDVELTKA